MLFLKTVQDFMLFLMTLFFIVTIVTEQEIDKGILAIGDANDTTFYVKRSFENTDDVGDSKTAGRFFGNYMFINNIQCNYK